MARLLFAALALLVAGWLGLQAIGAHAEQELIRLSLVGDGRLTAAQRDRAETLAARADRLNPDTRPEQLRGIVALRNGDPRGAAAIFEGVARGEPENPEAWLLLARAADAYDPALAARARSRFRELAPPLRR
jgi:predicted Zn-dependent protease